MDELPTPIGPSIDQVVNEALPPDIAAKRIQYLSEHADAVLELRDRHKRAWEEMLGREVRLFVMDGFSPRLAEAAAQNNLSLRKQELDAELEEAVQREGKTLMERMRRLVENLEAEG